MGHIYRWLKAVFCSIASACVWVNNEPNERISWVHIGHGYSNRLKSGFHPELLKVQKFTHVITENVP